MHTSKAKVYSLHKLMECNEIASGQLFVNPSVVNIIEPRNYMIDSPERDNCAGKK